MFLSILSNDLYVTSNLHFFSKEHQILPGLCELWDSLGAASLCWFFPLTSEVFYSHICRSFLRQRARAYIFQWAVLSSYILSITRASYLFPCKLCFLTSQHISIPRPCLVRPPNTVTQKLSSGC